MGGSSSNNKDSKGKPRNLKTAVKMTADKKKAGSKGMGSEFALPKMPKFEMPSFTMPELPPPAVPAPNQTLTTDMGQAEDDARVSALRRKGLAGGNTILAGRYKPSSSKLGTGNAAGAATMG